MVADSALLIEQLAANAWPAATVRLVDGWLLRYTPGVARRRSNSALPSPGATCASPAQRALARVMLDGSISADGSTVSTDA